MSGLSKMLNFISDLKANNNRDWFAENKLTYETTRNECYAEIETLLNRLSATDKSLIGVTAKDCTYRIYRDIRFSADKSPYKTHFGIVIAQNGRKCKQAGRYIHIAPGECALYGGVWFPEPPILKFLRRNIFENIEEFEEILNRPEFKAAFPTLIGDELKTMPKGFPKDSPYGDILRKKEFLVQKPYPDSFFRQKDWMDILIADMQVMQPFLDFLNYAFEELHSGEYSAQNPTELMHRF